MNRTFNNYRGCGLNTPELDTLYLTVFADPYNPKNSVVASGRWLTIRKASWETGHSYGRLRAIACGVSVRSILVDGRWYIFEDSVDNLKPPEGYWSLDKAIGYSGLCGEQIKRLRRRGIIGGTVKHNQVYVDEISFREYISPPSGYLSREEAKDFWECATEKPLERLVKRGMVGTKEKNGKKFYSIWDLRKCAGVPEGYISIRQASRIFPYDEAEIKDIASKNKLQAIQSGNATYIPEAALEGFASSQRPTLERIVVGIFDEEVLGYDSSEEVVSAIAKRLGIIPNGSHANGSKNGHSPHNGRGITLDLIAGVVKIFE